MLNKDRLKPNSRFAKASHQFSACVGCLSIGLGVSQDWTALGPKISAIAMETRVKVEPCLQVVWIDSCAQALGSSVPALQKRNASSPDMLVRVHEASENIQECTSRGSIDIMSFINRI